MRALTGWRRAVYVAWVLAVLVLFARTARLPGPPLGESLGRLAGRLGLR